jgi:hypothetical protein
MSQSIHTQLAWFCPCQEGDFYKKVANKITKDGVYKTKNDQTPRQMYFGHGGKHRCSPTRYSD